MPSHRSRQPWQLDERKRRTHRFTRSHDPDGPSSAGRVHALDVAAGGRRVIPVGRDGTQPAQQLGGRRHLVGHVTREACARLLMLRFTRTVDVAPAGFTLGQLDHAAAVATPATGHGIDVMGEHRLLLDPQLAAHRVVVERGGPPGGGDVEAGQVPAAVAAVSRGAHGHHGSRRTPAQPEGRPGSNAVQQLRLLGGEFLLGEDPALAQIIELDQTVTDLILGGSAGPPPVPAGAAPWVAAAPRRPARTRRAGASRRSDTEPGRRSSEAMPAGRGCAV